MRAVSRLFLLLTAASLITLFGGYIAYSADEANVKFSQVKGYGQVLVDAKGMTLYIFKNDKKDKSNCAADCLAKWPAFFVEKAVPGKGLKAADFGTIKRDDGKSQTTYKGHPLYYFFQDKVEGDTKGNKVKDVWFIVTPSLK